MKKLLYLLLLTPIIFLTSCSSGGDGGSSPSNENLFVGSWGLNGMDLDIRHFQYLPNGETETLLDTSVSLNGTEVMEIIGYIQTLTVYENGTLQVDQFDGTSTSSSTGTWSIQGNTITLDDDGPYPFTISDNNCTISGLSNLENNGDGTWTETSNGVMYYERVNGYTPNYQNSKKRTHDESPLQSLKKLIIEK